MTFVTIIIILVTITKISIPMEFDALEFGSNDISSGSNVICSNDIRSNDKF
jgi:hypothetical protein